MNRLLHKTWLLSNHIMMCYCLLFVCFFTDSAVITINTNPSQRKLVAQSDIYPTVTLICAANMSGVTLENKACCIVAGRTTVQQVIQMFRVQLCGLWCRLRVRRVCVSLCILNENEHTKGMAERMRCCHVRPCMQISFFVLLRGDTVHDTSFLRHQKMSKKFNQERRSFLLTWQNVLLSY